MKKIALLIIICVFSSCTYFSNFNSQHSNLVSKLNNQGIVTLSPDNPYVAPNLLLAKEIADSQELEGFIRHKGTPNLIEVKKSFFGNLKYVFYYPREKSFFNLEKVNDLWVINGPNQISDIQNRQIYYLTGGQLYEPKILSKEEIKNVYKDEKTSSNNSASSIDKMADELNSQSSEYTYNEPKDNDIKANININNNEINKANISENNINQATIQQPQAPTGYMGATNNIPQDNNLDAIIRNNSSYTSELNFKGDLIHYVTYKGENLSLISRWYTKDPQNAEKIARINSIDDNQGLEVGDKIIIPSYLVKNKNRLTQPALKELQNIYDAGSQNVNISAPSAPTNQNSKDIEFF